MELDAWPCDTRQFSPMGAVAVTSHRAYGRERKAEPLQRHLLGSPDGQPPPAARMEATYTFRQPWPPSSPPLPGSHFLRKPPPLFLVSLIPAGVSSHSTSSFWSLKTGLRTPLTREGAGDPPYPGLEGKPRGEDAEAWDCRKQRVGAPRPRCREAEEFFLIEI